MFFSYFRSTSALVCECSSVTDVFGVLGSLLGFHRRSCRSSRDGGIRLIDCAWNRMAMQSHLLLFLPHCSLPWFLYPAMMQVDWRCEQIPNKLRTPGNKCGSVAMCVMIIALLKIWRCTKIEFVNFLRTDLVIYEICNMHILIIKLLLTLFWKSEITRFYPNF